MSRVPAGVTAGIALLTLSWAGCSSSGLGTEDTAALAAACPWRGEWALETTRCGEYSLPNWNQTYTEVRLQLEGDEEGCTAWLTWTGPTCTESETWSFVADAEGSIDIARYGIDHCDPVGCTFFTDRPEDLPCALGDRNNRSQGWIESEDEDELLLVDFARHAWPGCSYGEGPGGANYLPMYTRWTR